MAESADDIRARGIRRDIFARHNIPEGTPDDQAAAMVEYLSSRSAAQPGAWANPDERAKAREEYASRGKTPDEVQRRWEESIYLVDPATHEFRQRYQRDKEFLDRMAGRSEQMPASVNAWAGAPADPQRIADVRTQNAVEAWDKSNNNPLYRNSWRDSGGWASQESVAAGLANAATNPDLATGSALLALDVPYNFLAMQGSGESSTARESMRTALGGYQAASQNRLDSGAPILDLPSTATAAERAERLRELQKQAASAAVPDSAERWIRTTGRLPSPAIRDMGEIALSTLDGTQFIPGATLGKSAVKGAGKAAAKGAARDMASDAVISTGLTGPLLINPSRTWAEYTGYAPEDTSAVTVKTPQEVAEAKAARQQMFERTLGSQGVSTADSEAYNRLQRAGAAPLRNQ